MQIPKTFPWDYRRAWLQCPTCDGREIIWTGEDIRPCRDCGTGYQPDRRWYDLPAWLFVGVIRILAVLFYFTALAGCLWMWSGLVGWSLGQGIQH